MNVHHFRHFIAVAEELHFGRAAHRLNIEQAPLSQSIRRLESALEVTLFDRSRRSGTRLTPAGHAFLDEARKALAQFDRAVSLARRAGGATLPVKVGFVTAATFDLLPSAIRDFKSIYPDATLQLRESSTTELLDAVANDQVDLALVHPVKIVPPGLSVEHVRSDKTVIALPADHRLARRKALSMTDLAGTPLIFFPRSASPDLHQRFMEFFRSQGVEPKIEQEARLTPTILSLVGAGLGYALIQGSAKSVPFANVAFRPLSGAPDELDWRLSIVWKPDVATSLAKALHMILRQTGPRT